MFFIEVTVLKRDGNTEKRIISTGDILSVKEFKKEDGSVSGSVIFFLSSKSNIVVKDDYNSLKEKLVQ